MEYRIEVYWQAGVPDGRVADLLAQIAQLGLDQVRSVRVSDLYFLRGELTPSDLERLATELLADPVVEGFHIVTLPAPPEEEGAIVEVPGIISGLGIRGFNMAPLPEPIAELCRRELVYSSMVVDACYHGDRDLALQALLFDPMINDIDRARAILDDFLAEFAEYLPQFTP